MQLQQPNIVGNFLNAYQSGLERQEAQKEAERQRLRQDRADQMNEQRFGMEMDEGQLNMALRRGAALNDILAGVDERNPQTLEMAKQRYLTTFGGKPEDVAQITMADIPRIKLQTGQTLKELDLRLKQAQIAAANRSNRGGGGSTIFNNAAQRAQLAQQVGLDLNTPAGKKYILTGQLPAGLAQSEKKTITEADQMVMATGQGLKMLQEARNLSDKSNAGFAANTLAQIPALFGDESAQNTLVFDNLLQSQVLPQLKAIFGGAPTEGERSILLELQGSSSLPWPVRNRIIDRAINMANERLQFYQQQSDELRSGTYFNPRQPDRAAAPPAAPAAQGAVPRAAPPQGAPSPRPNIPPPPPGARIIP
jgi:hypothetical protein